MNWLEEEGEVGDGRAEGSSAIGHRGQAAVSLMLNADGTHVRMFESSQLEGSDVGDFLYYNPSFHFTDGSTEECFLRVPKNPDLFDSKASIFLYPMLHLLLFSR